MLHEMKLDREQFEEIASGNKKVEYRLNDEKRKRINPGDTIRFYKRPDNIKRIDTKVEKIKRYRNLTELVEETPLNYWGLKFQNKQQIIEQLQYYSEEEIRKYGVVAIYLDLQ